MIREQAIIVAEYEGMRGGGHDYQFHCGRSWLRGFKKRYGITDGVITRVGYTPADLAREKAYGSYPLDDPFWSQLPDEHGNVPLPFGRDKTEFDDMDFEFDGPFVVYKPRVDPAATPTDYAALPPSGLATPSEDVTPLISQSQRHHVSFDLSSSSFDTSQSGVDSVSESKAWSFTNDPPNGQSAWEASYRQCHFHESFTRETSL
ncbi:uncharacterized protein B0H18DRAFT_1125543 [Fomitopsis serialis]|uniref:uncharacterized protein n=1 Tax=Fomitopsis serialis TaxID=139415 RepID=UPI002008B4CC|nr:uncharacterized protein B0H18DRAFT_1125543 [Neoantrodia serialis]KAH9914445.1 hypothetical protein B0H18DRAFT_1125543 [Neoantrodia serialis]